MTACDRLILPESPGDRAAVDALIDRVFGPGRFAKAAERLREGRAVSLEHARLVRVAGALVGCVRLWPIAVGGTDALLLGPIAVEPAHQGGGLGAELVRAARDGAAALPILLIGDAAYFGAFGFTAAAAQGVIMPGPVDPRRVLASAFLTGEARAR